MRIFSISRLAFVLACTLPLAACDTSGQLGLTSNKPAQYKVNLHLPADWQVASTEQDPGGYFKSYRPVDSLHADPAVQSVSINYGTGNTKSANAGMQEVMQVDRSLGCQSVNSHVIGHQKNSITFTTSLSQCPHGIALKKTTKIFVMPDGHYSIMYAANSNIVSAAMIQKMSHVVQAAQLSHQ